jgi:hypothetical protein
LAYTAIVFAAFFEVASVAMRLSSHYLVLPFDVYVENNSKKEIGAALSAELAAYLNEFRETFNMRSSEIKPPTPKKYGSKILEFDVVDNFIADMIGVTLKTTEAFDVDTVTLKPIKLGPIDIPLDEWVYNFLPELNRETISTAINVLDGKITATVKIGRRDPVTIEVPQKSGYDTLIKQIAAHVIISQRWLDLPVSGSDSVVDFIDAVTLHKKYLLTRRSDISASAVKMYDSALKKDPAFSLARLYLAAMLYYSPDPKSLREAEQDFSIAASNDELRNYAQIGWLATSLHALERDQGCLGTLQIVRNLWGALTSWKPDRAAPSFEQFVKVVLKARAYTLIAVAARESPCGSLVPQTIGQSDFVQLLSDSYDSLDESIRILYSLPDSPYDATDHRDLYVELLQKYALDELAEYQYLRHDLEGARRALMKDLYVGYDLARTKAALPHEEQVGVLKYLAPSLADSLLKLASISADGDAESLVAAARRLLLGSVPEEFADVSAWSKLRLADAAFYDGDVHEGLDWLIQSADGNQNLQDPAELGKWLDQGALKYGILRSKSGHSCETIAALKVLRRVDPSSLMISVYLLEQALQAGDRTDIDSIMQRILQQRQSMMAIRGWFVDEKIDLSAAKVAVTDHPENGGEIARGMLSSFWNQANNKIQSDLVLLGDAYEISESVGLSDYSERAKKVLPIELTSDIIAKGLTGEDACGRAVNITRQE